MLRDRNVLLVVLARFVSRVGAEAAFFVGIWGKAAFEFDADPGELALLMAALAIASLAGGAIAGPLIDRFNPRRVLLVGEILFVPAALAITLAGSMSELTVLVMAIGFFGAPVITSISSMAPFLTSDPNRLSRINGQIEAAGMAAFVVGPAVGAIIARWFSIDWIFVFDAASSLLAAAMVLFLTLRPAGKSPDRSGFKELREGFSYTYRHSRLRFYVLLGTAVWLTFGTFGALEPIFFRDVVGTNVETLGWVNAVFGVGLVTGSLAVARIPQRLITARVAAIAVALNGAGAFVYAGTPRLGVVVIGAMLWGTIIGLMAPMIRTLIQFNSPDALVGRISSVTQVHADVAHLIPLAIAPAAAAAFGVQRTMIGSALLLSVIAIISLPRAGRLDRSREVAVERGDQQWIKQEPKEPGRLS